VRLGCRSGDGAESRVGLRGIGPALAGKLAGVWAFALRARDEVDRFQCSLRPDPAAAGACVVVGNLPVLFWADAWVSVVADWLRFLGVRLRCRSGDGGWVAGQGSAGSVLRWEGALEQEELSRYRADGIRMWTFQCSLLKTRSGNDFRIGFDPFLSAGPGSVPALTQ